ncbi:MAG TPA: adenine phosphoribosyltransferase [Acidimicrobiales bacterium]|nr:adenine phosphoribosyltransferase [Acidimicrobiales bacterium]
MVEHPDTAAFRALVRDIPDFPQPGVLFRDITPLLADADAFAAVVERLAEAFEDRGVDKVVGIEARGFVIAAPVAVRLGAGFVPVRKVGKLPWTTEAQEYELEYGTDRLEVHRDAIAPGERVIVVDDVIATGGTATATVRLVESLGGAVLGLGFVIDLSFLGGLAKLDGRETVALLTYE